MTTIVDDTRPILSAWSEGEDAVGARVGFAGVTRIEPYTENGQGAPVPWLKFWKDDVLYMRLNCAHMAEITYAEEADDDKT